MPKPANIITLSRVLLSAGMIFLSPSSTAFGAGYLLCGISDMADGHIARMTHTESRTGARFDSAADILFFCVCAAKLLPLMHLKLWMWLWTAAIAVIKLAGMLLRYKSQHSFAPPHSPANRLMGLLLFLMPLTLPFADIIYSVVPVCAAATFTAVQDVYFAVNTQ